MVWLGEGLLETMGARAGMSVAQRASVRARSSAVASKQTLPRSFDKTARFGEEEGVRRTPPKPLLRPAPLSSSGHHVNRKNPPPFLTILVSGLDPINPRPSAPTGPLDGAFYPDEPLPPQRFEVPRGMSLKGVETFLLGKGGTEVFLDGNRGADVR